MTTTSLGRTLGSRGYSHLDATLVAAAVGPRALANWEAFARSWNALELDGFMADGGTYRRRRYACYAVRGTKVARLPQQPHYQTTRANPLNGGIDRWFAPVDDATGRHPVLRRLLSVCARTFAAAAGVPAANQSWLVEAHQFRIEATADAAGLPTPEGVHRDGVDWVFVCLVGSSNVAGGMTTIHGADGRPLEAVHAADAARGDGPRRPPRVPRRHARARAAPRRAGSPGRAGADLPRGRCPLAAGQHLAIRASRRGAAGTLRSEVELHAQLEQPRVENAERHLPPRVRGVQ